MVAWDRNYAEDDRWKSNTAAVLPGVATKADLKHDVDDLKKGVPIAACKRLRRRRSNKLAMMDDDLQRCVRFHAVQRNCTRFRAVLLATWRCRP